MQIHKLQYKGSHMGVFFACLIGIVLVLLLACEVVGTDIPEEKNGVISVSIVERDFSLGAGTNVTLTVKVKVLGTTKDTVTWDSDKQEIAKVDKNGKVTGVTEGKATIIATSTEDTNKNATVTVTVTKVINPTVTSVTLALDDPKVTSIDKGSTAKMTATVDTVGAAAETVTFTETDVNGKEVTSTGIVTLDNKDGKILELTGKKPGDTWIVATSTEDPKKKSAAVPITVNGVVSVSIVEADFELTMRGTTKQLSTQEEAYGTAKGKGVTWESDKQEIAKVDKNGKVTGVTEGKATIIATSTEDTNKNATVTVEVVAAPTVTSVTLALDDPKVTSIDKGSTAKMTATVDTVGAAAETVTFTETDVNGKEVTSTGIVTLDNKDGKILELTGKKPGDTWIVATSTEDPKKKSAAVPITVNGVVSVSIEEGDFTLAVTGQKILSTQEEAYGTAKGKGVTWESDDQEVATVDTGTGEVTAVKLGTAKITATSKADLTQKTTVTVTAALPLYYREVAHGTTTTEDSKVLPGLTITGYTLAVIGTGTVELPTINPNTGEITVTTSTTAGTYRITATADIGKVEAMFYVITSPTNLANLETAVKTGIENFGNTADLNYIKTDAITTMNGLFNLHTKDGKYVHNAKPFVKNFNGDISKWNVVNVKNMFGVFQSATVFTGDLSDWNVSNVENMSNMFQSAAAFTGDLSDWNVTNVENMSSMFGNATAFDSDLSGWDVANVENMTYMFSFAKAFKVNNLEIWETKLHKNVKTTGMFLWSGLAIAKDLPSWYKP